MTRRRATSIPDTLETLEIPQEHWGLGIARNRWASLGIARKSLHWLKRPPISQLPWQLDIVVMATSLAWLAAGVEEKAVGAVEETAAVGAVEAREEMWVELRWIRMELNQALRRVSELEGRRAEAEAAVAEVLEDARALAEVERAVARAEVMAEVEQARSEAKRTAEVARALENRVRELEEELEEERRTAEVARALENQVRELEEELEDERRWGWVAEQRLLGARPWELLRRNSLPERM